MKQNFYSVYDMAAKVWNPPQVLPTDAVAIRQMMEACTRPDSVFAKHPKDFALFQVGEWDDVAGEMKPVVARKVVDVAACVNPQERPAPQYGVTNLASRRDRRAKRKEVSNV